MDLTCKQLLTLVECLFTKKLSIAWAFNWKSSHQHLFSFKSVTSLCPMRQKTDIVEKTQAFIDKLGNFLEIVSIPSYAIINYDEVRISATRDKFEVHRLIDRRKLKPQHASYISGADIGTYIPFVAADGHVFYSFFILKHKFGSNPSDDVTLSLPDVKKHPHRSRIPESSSSASALRSVCAFATNALLMRWLVSF